VTSQFDVIFMFSNQRFGEVSTDNMHILPHALPYFMCHCTEYKLSTLQVRILEENKLNAAIQQFITAKISGCASKQMRKHSHHCFRAIYNCKMMLRCSGDSTGGHGGAMVPPVFSLAPQFFWLDGVLGNDYLYQ